MSSEMNDQLVNTFKVMIQDHGISKCRSEINDENLRAAVAAHADEFDEALGECESELTIF